MLRYLSLDIICSSRLTIFLKLRSRENVHFSKQNITAERISGHISAPNGGYCLYIMTVAICKVSSETFLSLVLWHLAGSDSLTWLCLSIILQRSFFSCYISLSTLYANRIFEFKKVCFFDILKQTVVHFSLK